jgi:branched-chain amino acid transport system substrate-binding protein
LDKKSKISTLPLDKLRKELNNQIITGKYNTPLGEIGFTAVGDVIQKEFYVAKIKMDKDGNTGKFVFIK